MGGISNWQDAVQYIAAGSDVVQICTEVNGYGIIDKLKSGLLNYLEEKNMNSLSDLKNIVINKIVPHKDLNINYQMKPQIDTDKCVLCRGEVKTGEFSFGYWGRDDAEFL